jgi:hypothetical protein
MMENEFHMNWISNSVLIDMIYQYISQNILTPPL